MTEHTKILSVYKSSAGSGKTYTLALQYLTIALSYDDAFKHILALTFTNKAAQEMKDRVLFFLEEIIDFKDNPPEFVTTLLNSIPKYKEVSEQKSYDTAIKKLKGDSKNLYKRILHHYSEYAVTTLDSFTNRLIRSFSHDLGLSFNYQVELDTKQLLKDAVEELVNRIGIHEDMLTKVLTQYSKQKIDSETSRRINGELEARAKSLLNDVEEKYLKPLRLLNIEDILQVQKRLIKEINHFETQLQASGEEFISICQNAGIEMNMFAYGKSSIYNYFDRFRERDFEKYKPGIRIINMIETGQWTTKSAPIENKQLIDSVADSLLQIYQQTAELIANESSNYLLMKQMKKGIFPYMVLMELEKILSQIKEENQMVHISDFNKIISDEIAHESAPYIYERIGNKYQHYLLDEFQDTSVIQWHNLLPLIENSLSENNFNLIVGDAKQAIYRWRGSEVEQFARLPELIDDDDSLLFKQRENMLINNYHEVHLNTNYRSQEAIITFNNSLFQYVKEHYLPESLKNIYQHHKQEIKDDNKNAGMVNIHFIELPPKSTNSVYEDAYQKQTLQIIHECLSNGYNYKDIAILTRGNKDLLALSTFLIENNIPIISSESLYVDTSQHVQFVISLIKYFQQPKELVYQLEILKYLLENKLLGDDSIENLPDHLQRINADDAMQKYWDQLRIDFKIEDILSLQAYEAIETIVRLFKLDNSESLLHFFIEATYMFTQDKHQGLLEFYKWWEIKNKDFSLEVPEDWDAVKLMTFHKAKGLEFPVVINWFSQKLLSNKKGQSTVWINPELEKIPELKSFPFLLSSLENTKHQSIYDLEMERSTLDDVNLFYVANTRPTEKLFLLIDQYMDSKSTSKNFPFSKLMKEFVEAKELKQVHEGIYCLGHENDLRKKVTEANKKHNVDNKLILKKVNNVNWKEEVILALDKDNEKEWNKSAAWGQKVHLVLAEINTRLDIESAFKRLIYKGVIEKDEQKIIEDLVLHVLDNVQLMAYYQKGVCIYNERDIFNNKGEIFRPDRIVIMEDHAVVIDYKTGQPKEKDQQQVKNYKDLIGKYLNKKVKALLVYLHEDIIVEEVVN